MTGVQRLFVGKVKDFRTHVGVLTKVLKDYERVIPLSECNGHKCVNGIITNIDEAGINSVFPTDFDASRKLWGVE